MLRTLLTSVVALGVGGQPALACIGPGTTQVDEIYPSGAVVPENILRLYLYFTAPMGDTDILPSINLFGEDGSLIEGAFLSNRYELWSADRTRLTLLLDPGRVKTGLEAHDALGRALTAGQAYVLTVDASAWDATGCGLQSSFTHYFLAGPSDADPPDPAVWDVDLPQSGTHEPLRITLDSPHDHLSMAFGIQVRRNGEALPGRLNLDASETVWLFTPRRPWADDLHELSIDPEFEDLAGNRPGQLFDQQIGLELPQPDLHLRFRPGP